MKLQTSTTTITENFNNCCNYHLLHDIWCLCTSTFFFLWPCWHLWSNKIFLNLKHRGLSWDIIFFQDLTVQSHNYLRKMLENGRFWDTKGVITLLANKFNVCPLFNGFDAYWCSFNRFGGHFFIFVSIFPDVCVVYFWVNWNSCHRLHHVTISLIGS